VLPLGGKPTLLGNPNTCKNFLTKCHTNVTYKKAERLLGFSFINLFLKDQIHHGEHHYQE
jgi:hypothetical protein